MLLQKYSFGFVHNFDLRNTMQVQFFFIERNITLRNRSKLKGFINSIFKRNKLKLGHLNYVFCSDDYLLQINKAHLKHDFYTDIITFDLSSTKEYVDGEIYISTDRVRDNASMLKTTITEELHRVIFHGALHLCGYKDKTADQAKQMRAAENNHLKLYFKS